MTKKKKFPENLGKSPQVCTESFPGLTYIAFILDESGSMSPVREAVIEGFDGFVEQQRQLHDDNIRFSLFQFDHNPPDENVREKYHQQHLTAVLPLKDSGYHPRGSTPLLDAIGTVIHRMDAAATKDDRLLIVIQTDGQENCSSEYTKPIIQKLIADMTANGNWTFVYMSADPNAFADAQSYNIPVGNIQQYQNTGPGNVQAFVASSVSTASYSRAGGQSVSDFFQQPGATAIAVSQNVLHGKPSDEPAKKKVKK